MALIFTFSHTFYNNHSNNFRGLGRVVSFPRRYFANDTNELSVCDNTPQIHEAPSNSSHKYHSSYDLCDRTYAANYEKVFSYEVFYSHIACKTCLLAYHNMEYVYTSDSSKSFLCKKMVGVAGLEPARLRGHQIFLLLHVTMAAYALQSGLCLHHIISEVGAVR